MNVQGLASAHLGLHLLRVAEKQIQHTSAASCGSVPLDEAALGGGFRYGELTSIAGSSSTGKSIISYHAAASHLLNNEYGEVVFIDTNGSFSVERLRDIIALRLHAKKCKDFQQVGYIYKESAPRMLDEQNDTLSEAISMLDRVKLMSTFNISGMVEAVGEVREALGKSIESRGSAPLRKGQKGIIDSEDEEDLEGRLEVGTATDETTDANDGASRIGMLIVDTVAAVANPLMAKDYVQGKKPPVPKW